MKQESKVRGEVIMAGLGGGGVLMAGTLLGEAAMKKYKNVTWFPSYAISKRGGLSECTIVFSNHEIASPLLSQSNGVIVAESGQVKDFETRVRSGGTLVVESTGLEVELERTDIEIIKVPAIETAVRMAGTSRGANLILLGVFVQATQIILPEIVERQIKDAFAGKQSTLQANRDAFLEGRNFMSQS